MDEDQLVLHYQPIGSLSNGSSGRTRGTVARTIRNGASSDHAFLGLAEETGAIVRMGAWVLEACRQAMERKKRYGSYPFTMAVNLSPRQLFEDDVIDMVRASLLRSGFAQATSCLR